MFWESSFWFFSWGLPPFSARAVWGVFRVQVAVSGLLKLWGLFLGWSLLSSSWWVWSLWFPGSRGMLSLVVAGSVWVFFSGIGCWCWVLDTEGLIFGWIFLSSSSWVWSMWKSGSRGVLSAPVSLVSFVVGCSSFVKLFSGACLWPLLSLWLLLRMLTVGWIGLWLWLRSVGWSLSSGKCPGLRGLPFYCPFLLLYSFNSMFSCFPSILAGFLCRFLELRACFVQDSCAGCRAMRMKITNNKAEFVTRNLWNPYGSSNIDRKKPLLLPWIGLAIFPHGLEEAITTRVCPAKRGKRQQRHQNTYKKEQPTGKTENSKEKWPGEEKSRKTLKSPGGC
ncbi:hypothetical protein MA16_Dca020261 [Dendrobium catenatum]|uniref:Uncharacterized protein n=1 Tax=Dendrobium catenatum TaxID=906689 RepID=A0A2I0WAZ0_9ASPA|nr:hypothetical protein MA16_Dca020261 [Dendrobium catenatum]